MSLSFVNRPWRTMPVSLNEPAIEVIKDCVYVPIDFPVNFWENPNWGVYDSNGTNIQAATNIMRPNMERSGQSDKITIDISSIEYAPCERYFYIGIVLNHYGHFICSSMPRLWALEKDSRGKIPLLGHSAGNPDAWFSWPHVTALYGAAGIARSDFASFDRPVRIRELVIAHPSFVELNHAHETFARHAHEWGDRLVVTQDTKATLDIAYLSKERLNGSSYLRNEAALTEAMREAGVPVFHPEAMTAPEQVALFRRTKCIMGQSGSAFHTSIFSRSRPDRVTISINHNPHFISDNHALIDAINLQRSYYVYFDAKHDSDAAGAYMEIGDPRAAALEMIDLVHSLVK